MYCQLRNAFGDLDRRVIAKQVTTRYVSLIALAIERMNLPGAPLRLGAGTRGGGVCRLIIRDTH